MAKKTSTRLGMTVWRKVIRWKLCKRSKIDLTIKWYVQKLESIQENKTHKLLRDFEIETDQRIALRRSDFVSINKKKELVIIWKILMFQHTEIKRKRKDRKILEPFLRVEKAVKYEVTVILIVVRTLGMVPKTWTKKNRGEPRPSRRQHC